jgi:ATP-binding cassette, subfamily B, bacterial
MTAGRMSPHAMLGADPAGVAGATFDPGVIRRVLRFARPYRAMLLGLLGVIVVAALVSLIPPLLFRAIIDDAVPTGDRGLLHLLAALVVAAAVVEAGLSLTERWLSARVGEGVIFDLRVALFDHVQRLPIAFFTRTQTGALTSRLNNDVIGAQRALTGTVGSVVSNVVVLVATLAAIIALEWRFALITLVLLPIFIIPARRVGRRLQAITRRQMDLNASMNTTMTERFGVAGALLVKLFGRADDEVAGFAESADGVRSTGVQSAVYGRIFFVALTLVGALATAAVYWIGGLLVIGGTMTLGTLVALAAFIIRVYGPLTALTNARVDLMTAVVSFERVFEVLDAANPLPDRPDAVELVEPTGRVELDRVTFAYPTDPIVPSLEAEQPGAAGAAARAALLDGGLSGDGRAASGPVLHEVTAVIEPGQLVAVVGPSGAGKSTLVSLVARLYDVTGGAVRVDGHDVRDLTQDSLRAAIGVVSQDPHLFHDSIAANLRYARPGATDAELVEACRAAQVHHVIHALPDGYDTVVGERGYRLSGGEKQRVAIARMLLKDPAIVILDEATSHLDSENEASVQRALAIALRGRTSLVIAHRLSTITAADQILVLDRGRLVQQGDHGELLLAGGLYADLYRTLVRGDAEALPS